jgi:tRNA pseudouridine13 synthase
LTHAAEAEIAVGIEWYATSGEPCHARAKSTPDDFVVEELIGSVELSSEDRPDYFPVYRVEKRSIDTMHMAMELSHDLRSKVAYAGMKDKKSRATQYATPTSLRSDRPSRVVRERFTADLIGYAPRPLSREAVVGNRFEIILRECCPHIEGAVAEAIRCAEARKVPNFYGLQRFGAKGAGTHRIGKALIGRNFQEAVRLILLEPRPSDSEEVRAAREAMTMENYDAFRLLPLRMDVERVVARELSRHPGEWVRALRAISVRLRRLYVQAYQAMIFNKALSGALANGEDVSTMRSGDNWAEVQHDGLVTARVRGVRDLPSGEAVPLMQIVGYAYRDYGSRFDAYVNEILKAEEVTPGKFYVKEMQEVSSEGGFRRPHLAIREASWNAREETARLEFTLARGQYATVLLREIVKPSDPAAAGFA